jgi:hypothetical protein
MRGASPLALLILPAVVWLYGWRTTDTVEWRTITAAPFAVSLDPAQQFLYGSPFTFLLGSYYQHQGLTFDAAFAVVHGVGLVLFGCAMFHALTTLCSASGRAAGAIVLAGSPLLFVVLTWIGKSDTYLLAFYLLLVSTHSPLTQSILAVLMIACHRELATAMLIAHSILHGPRISITAGAAVGLACSFAFTSMLLDSVPASRFEFMLANARQLLRNAAAHPLTYLAAALGPFWLYVARPTALSAGRVAVLVMAIALATVAYDFTRVFVIVATPLLLVLTREVVEELRGGGMLFWGYRVRLGVLAALAFAQIQIAGGKVIWVRGVEWFLTR